MRRLSLALVGLAACGASGRARSPAAPPVVVAVADVEAARTVVAAPDTESSLVAKVYAAVRAKDWPDAHRWTEVRAELRRSRMSAAESDAPERTLTCYGVQRRGLSVFGGSGVVDLDEGGALKDFRDFGPACVLHADDRYVVTDDGVSVRLLERGRANGEHEDKILAALPVTRTSTTGHARVMVDDGWALVVMADGAWIARRQRNGQIVRGVEKADAATPLLSGGWLVTSGTSGVRAEAADGKTVALRGCAGRLLDLYAVRDGFLLQVRSSKTRCEGDECEELSPDSALCLLGLEGKLRRRTELGSATCGLAVAMPCSWSLAGISSVGGSLRVSLESMRGQTEVVDPSSGRVISSAWSTSSVDDEPATEEPAWCQRGGLPVPPEVCSLAR